MKAKEDSSSAGDSVNHWQVYTTNIQTLLPWLDQAEQYLAIEKGKTSSVDQVRQQYDEHQAFLEKQDQQQEVFDHLMEEASYMMNRPQVASDAEQLQKRWDQMATRSDDCSQVVLRALEAWTAYSEDVGEVQRVKGQLEERLAEEPKTNSIHIAVLSKELDAYRVRMN